MEEDGSKVDPERRDDPPGAERLRASAAGALRRARTALTCDRALAALCLAAALVTAAPWIRVPVADLVDREVSYSVPDLLAAGQLAADRAQSIEDLVEAARETAERAGRIIERVQDAAERMVDAREGRG